MELVKHLQTNVAPQIFTPPAVYDGRKNMFAPHLLPFAGGATSQEVKMLLLFSNLVPPSDGYYAQFDVNLGDPAATANKGGSGKGPKGFKIRLTKVAEINPM